VALAAQNGSGEHNFSGFNFGAIEKIPFERAPSEVGDGAMDEVLPKGLDI
jgi:hypothetical protein